MSVGVAQRHAQAHVRLGPPLSYQIAWGESVFHAGRKNPLDYASCGNPASLPKASALLWPRHSLSGSAHSQAVFTAANGPREIQLSLRHPTPTKGPGSRSKIIRTFDPNTLEETTPEAEKTPFTKKGCTNGG